MMGEFPLNDSRQRNSADDSLTFTTAKSSGASGFSVCFRREERKKKKQINFNFIHLKESWRHHLASQFHFPSPQSGKRGRNAIMCDPLYPFELPNVLAIEQMRLSELIGLCPKKEESLGPEKKA